MAVSTETKSEETDFTEMENDRKMPDQENPQGQPIQGGRDESRAAGGSVQVESEAGVPAATEGHEAVDETAVKQSDSEPAATTTGATTPESQPEVAAPQPTWPRSSRITLLEDEPYEFDQCTVTIILQLMPDDAHPEGREVVELINTHNDIPIFRVNRLRELEPLPAWLASLLEELKQSLPGYGLDAARRREEEKALKRMAAAKTTGSRNQKTSATRSGSTTTRTNSSAAQSSLVAAETETSGDAHAIEGNQTSLFDLSAGR